MPGVIESDYGLVGGFLTDVLVDEHDGPPKSKTIIETDQHFHVSVGWHLIGTALDLAGPNLKFKVKLLVESMGPGPETIAATAEVPFVPPPAPSHHSDFSKTFDFAAGTLPEGVYRLVIALTATNAGKPINIAGYNDGPMIQVYAPHH